MGKLYKYLQAHVFEQAFPDQRRARLKANYPQNFNDPYELFLTVDTKGVSRDVLAFYQEIVGSIPQWPTVCFSARPDVTPMWAHYGNEFSGIVIEYDERGIRTALPKCTIDAVKYSSTPFTVDSDRLQYAHATSKPRHTYHLQILAFNAAYFTKSKHWAYELEKRLVADMKAVKIYDGTMIIELPIGCVTGIIYGPKTESKDVRKIRKFARKVAIPCYQLQISRSSMQSFFMGDDGKSSIFHRQKLVAAEYCCENCGEPLEKEAGEKCHWCGVGEDEKRDAAVRNPMRRLASLGLLTEYLDVASRL